MEEIKYTIGELLGICANYLNDPNNEAAANDFKKMKDGIMVKAYMPLQQKELLLRRALLAAQVESEDPHSFVVAEELVTLFYIKLSYVVNFDMASLESIWVDKPYADLICASGLDDYITKLGGRDMERTINMFYRTVSYDNLKNLIRTLEATTPENITDLVDAFNKFTMETDPAKLKLFGDIAAFNDPLLVGIKENIIDNAYEAIKEVENIQNN